MLETMQEELLVSWQIDAAEGKNLREYIKSGPGLARQARKQARETAELLIEITRELEK